MEHFLHASTFFVDPVARCVERWRRAGMDEVGVEAVISMRNAHSIEFSVKQCPRVDLRSLSSCTTGEREEGAGD